MKTEHMYVEVVAAIAVLVDESCYGTTSDAASAGKRAQYQQSGLNQNPTHNMENTHPNTDNDKGTNENDFGNAMATDL